MNKISIHSDAADKLVTPVSVGDWTLETFRITEFDKKMFVMRSAFQASPNSYYDSQIQHSFDYVRLMKGNTVWMSNTPMEIGTAMRFMKQAHGKVFVAGLGIGVTLLPVLEKEKVEEVIVCEIDQQVIDIWEKSSVNIDTSKLTIHNCDVHDTEKMLTDEKFDTLWFDIWPSICSDNYPETKELLKKYRKHINYKNDNKFVEFWMRDYIREQYHQEMNDYSYAMGGRL